MLWFTYKLGNFELSNTTHLQLSLDLLLLWFTYKLGNFELSNTTRNHLYPYL